MKHQKRKAGLRRDLWQAGEGDPGGRQIGLSPSSSL